MDIINRKTPEKLANMTKHKNLLWRILLLVLICVPLFQFRDFYQHFYVYLTGNILTHTIIHQWRIVVLSILLFVACLIPLSFRRKANWVERGLVSAFFISLFVEMYGIPLTILFASKHFFTAGTNLPNNVVGFNLFGVGFGMDWAMIYGALLMVIGGFLIVVGWVTLYRNIKKKGLVTNGIYSYSRHPQYFGFILITIGWFIGWPTIITIVFVPILIYLYIRLCKTEEKGVSGKFSEYQKYKEEVPFFI